MSRKITKKLLKYLAQEIMINFNDDELINLKKEFNVILKQMDLVQKIDTSNINPLNFPFDLTVNYLRNDDEINIISQKDILEIAPKKTKNYISINKVVE